MTKIIKMAYYLIYIGSLVVNVMSFNPMLTYTLRFKKIQVRHNISVDDYKIDRYKEGDFVNGKIKINSKEIINKAIVVIYRCDSDGINCEYFQTWTFGNVCNQLKENDQLWSRWCSSFDPPMVCPINKVTYQMKNATIDVGAALLFYPIATDYQWKVNVKFYSDDIFVGSVMIEFYFFGYRKKIKSILKP